MPPDRRNARSRIMCADPQAALTIFDIRFHHITLIANAIKPLFTFIQFTVQKCHGDPVTISLSKRLSSLRSARYPRKWRASNMAVRMVISSLADFNCWRRLLAHGPPLNPSPKAHKGWFQFVWSPPYRLNRGQNKRSISDCGANSPGHTRPWQPRPIAGCLLPVGWML